MAKITVNNIFSHIVNRNLRWPDPIYMRVGYVFQSLFWGRSGLTDFYDFWHP